MNAQVIRYVLLGVGALFLQSTIANAGSAFDGCLNPNSEARIAYCTVVIETETSNLLRLAAAYNNRGMASAQKGAYGSALEDYTQAEPLPWSDFFVARGRTLAAFWRGRRDAALTAELKRLRTDVDRVGLRIALPALETALTSAAAGGSCP